MKLSITLISQQKITLSRGYSGAIYRMILEHLKCGKEHSQLFVFSDLKGKRRYDKGGACFIFSSRVTLEIASPVQELLTTLGRGLQSSGEITLEQNRLRVESISTIPRRMITDQQITIHTTTPITIYSREIAENGISCIHYHPPDTPQFNHLINRRLKQKWEILYGEAPRGDLIIEPFKRFIKPETLYFQEPDGEILIHGWRGTFILTAPGSLLYFALCCGLGNRNSRGCGMVDILC